MAGHADLKQVHVVVHLDFESGGAEDPIQLQLLKAKERGFSYFLIQGGRPAINEEGAGRGYLCKGLVRADMERPGRPGVQTHTDGYLVSWATWEQRRNEATAAEVRGTRRETKKDRWASEDDSTHSKRV